MRTGAGGGSAGEPQDPWLWNRALAHENLEVDARVLRGRSSEEIMRAIDELRPYMIVIGSHRHDALQHLFVRSVGAKVVRRAPCPVLVVHPDDKGE